MWNLWVWEQPSWRVLAVYPSKAEALAAARHMADPPDTWGVCQAGSPKDEYMRAHCTQRMAHRVRRKAVANG